jgi:hypothetical protein
VFDWLWLGRESGSGGVVGLVGCVLKRAIEWCEIEWQWVDFDRLTEESVHDIIFGFIFKADLLRGLKWLWRVAVDGWQRD